MSRQLLSIRESFFNTVFSLLGHIANCDGFINRNEIKRIEIYMEKMSLSEKCKREAQHLFRAGTSPQFSISETLKGFSKNTTPNLIQILLVYLISMARTDGLLVKKEMDVVQQVAKELGYNSIVFDHLLKMISAQDEFAAATQDKPAQPTAEKSKAEQSTTGQKQQEKYEAPKQEQANHYSSGKSNFYKQSGYRNPALEEAYEALDVKAEMTEDEIRRAYQKLVSQFHPDKLVGQGMPPDLVAAATERFKKIQAAYDFIKKYRSIYAAI